MTKNIKLLLLSHALMGFVMWYAVEKIFLQSINVSIVQMGIIASSYIATSAIFNLPTGILADKLGRKTALIIAGVFLFASTVITGTAHDFYQYLIGAILWGVSFTTQNGAFSAMLYDDLKSNNKEKLFAKYKSYGGTMFWLAIFASSAIGAFIGNHLGLREVFYFTLIPNFICILACILLTEPKFHSKTESLGNFHMISQSFKTLFGSGLMIRLSVIFLCLEVLSWTYNEYDQLYFIALGFGVFGTGMLNSFSGLAQALGSYLGGKLTKINISAGLIITILLSLILYLFNPNTKLIGAIFFLVMVIALQITHINSETKLQHQIQSKIRATAMSSLSMVNDLIMVIMFMTFGFIGQNNGIKYGFLAVTIFVIIMFFLGYISSLKTNKHLLQTQS